MPPFYAHTKNHSDGTPCPENEWEPLFTEDCALIENGGTSSVSSTASCKACENLASDHGHLNKVAYLAGKFASEMFPAVSDDSKTAQQWGFLAGLWHDLGKFSNAFQKRIRGEISRANHSTAGAQYAEHSLRPIGHLLSYCIAGHHAGLPDLQKDSSSLLNRLSEKDYLSAILKDTAAKPDMEQLLRFADFPSKIPCSSNAQSSAFFTRLLYSCLVDADFIATEAFMNPARHKNRPKWPQNIMERMERDLNKRLKKFPPAKAKSIDGYRETIRYHCQSSAEKPPGIFTLTVPTGGGKTLSSLAFALRHARKHNLRRIIYVIPYTSIIEQNAAEFRDIFAGLEKELGQSLILEHHSNFDVSPNSSTEDTQNYKLLSENWDAPLVVTTNVQFLESLASHKTSRCRKVHNLARSVIIFDEAQSLPPDHLTPSLDFLKQLTSTANSSVVLCTATQPAIGKLPDDQPGNFTQSFNKIALPITEENEIIPEVQPLFNAFKRTNITFEEHPLDDVELANRMLKNDRILSILNTKPHASKVFNLLDPEDSKNIHLSAQLTPAHRQVILREIRARELNATPCRLVATTVIEAGVNLSFPKLYRAMTGLDSFAQAVGRCNRHGELKDQDGKPILGQVHLFTPADQPTPNFLKFSVNATASVLPDFIENPNDLLAPKAITKYFQHAYWQHGGQGGKGWDKPNFYNSFQLVNQYPPFLFNFKTFSRNFKLIADTQAPVIIEPHPDYMPGLTAKLYKDIPELLEQIRSSSQRDYPSPANAHRTLQRHTIQIPKNIHAALTATGDIQSYCDGRFPILTHPKNLYHPKLGLQIPTSIISNLDAFIL